MHLPASAPPLPAFLRQIDKSPATSSGSTCVSCAPDVAAGPKNRSSNQPGTAPHSIAPPRESVSAPPHCPSGNSPPRSSTHPITVLQPSALSQFPEDCPGRVQHEENMPPGRPAPRCSPPAPSYTRRPILQAKREIPVAGSLPAPPPLRTSHLK